MDAQFRPLISFKFKGTRLHFCRSVKFHPTIMELSREFRANRRLTALSHSGEYIALALGKTVEILVGATLEKANEGVELSGVISHLKWAATTAICVAASEETSSIVLLNADVEIVADIYVGDIGISAIEISPRGKFVLCFATGGSGCLVVDLENGCIENFIPCVTPDVVFSSADDDSIALFKEHPAGKSVHIVDISNGVILRSIKFKFPINGMCWDSLSDQFIVHGDGAESLRKYRCDGEFLCKTEGYKAFKRRREDDKEPVIKDVVMDGDLVYISTYTGIVSLINTRKNTSSKHWKTIYIIDAKNPNDYGDDDTQIYSEVTRKKYAHASTFKAGRMNVEVKRSSGTNGVGVQSMRVGNVYLAVVDSRSENLVQIYDKLGGSLVAVVGLKKAVRDMAWTPSQAGNYLVILTGDDQAFVWGTEGMGAMRIDNQATIKRHHSASRARFSKIVTARADGICHKGNSVILVDESGRCVTLYFATS